MAESINQYELAAGRRLMDALAVAVTDGRDTSRGGAYLFGFVIEMILKSAFFRLRGANPAQPVVLSAIASVVGKPRLNASDGHDLKLLRDALLKERATRGLALAPALASEIVGRVDRASLVWSVDLRYDGRPMVPVEIGHMFEDASWVYARRVALAR